MHSHIPHDSQRVPSIGLTSATPSSAGNSQPDASIDLARVAPWTSEPPQPLPAAFSSLRGTKTKLAPRADGSVSRTKLVPKKSKLGLLSQRLHSLSGGKENNVLGSLKSDAADCSINDNSMLDPDLGDIVMIKKGRSRVALGAIAWDGNTQPEQASTTAVKPTKEVPKKEKEEKREEKKEEKWWNSIAGRGRKDSKDKEKLKENAPQRAKASEPALERTRFNSLDSHMLLHSTTVDDQPKRAIRGRVTSAQLLNVVPTPILSRPSDAAQTSNQHSAQTVRIEVPEASTSTSEFNPGSVASRAMRSVRSIARIASWNQLKDTFSDEAEKDNEVNNKKKDTLKREKKPKDKKVKEKEKDRAATVRLSSSSFEIGALSPSRCTSPVETQSKTLGSKRSRIFTLGLGLPSSIRVRSGSTASSILQHQPTSFQHISEPMPLLGASVPRIPISRDRSGSGCSSLRPASTMTNSSGGSRLSTGSCAPSAMSRASSGASVRWDEEALQTVKERRRQERKEKEEQDAKEGKTKRESKESRNPKRIALADIFPSETTSDPSSRPTSVASSIEVGRSAAPILAFEIATNDRYSMFSHSSTETPVKGSRPRPLSDQTMNRDKLRPKGMMEDCEVISMLDAATNELAFLVNNLDLEATPATPDITPLKPSPLRDEDVSPTGLKSREPESPLGRKGNGLRPINSLKTTVREAATKAPLLGQHIAPWKDLNRQLSPARSPLKGSTPKAKFRLVHKRSSSVAPSPAPDAPPVFQPLQPASRRVTPMSQHNRESVDSLNYSCHVPSMITFGSRSSMSASDFNPESESEDVNKNVTIRKRRQRSSTESATSLPRMGRETRRRLGLSGTLGGSAASGYIPEELDPSDPDSDIPDELQVILGGQTVPFDSDKDDTLSFTGPLGAPPQLPLPNFDTQESENEDVSDLLPSVVVTEAEPEQDDDFVPSDEEDTKRSFDFTGEIKRLTGFNNTDQATFLEQLENAFRTPSKLDLRYGLEMKKKQVIPPVPKLPFEFAKNISKTSLGESLDLASGEPSILAGSDSFTQSEEEEDPDMTQNLTMLRNKLAAKSVGELNRDFKLGGKSPFASTLAPSPHISEKEKRNSTLTLSDIIPSPEHARSISLGEDYTSTSLYKSIFAAATQDMPSAMMMPSPHRHAISESAVRQPTRADITRRSMYDEAPSNRSSMISFSGLGDSFDEVRRGFEFHDNRPGFYPPVANASRGWNPNKRESVFSFASVSSYGLVVNPGIPDPFDYGTNGMGLTSLKERPSMEDLSGSLAVEDAFSFLRHGDAIQPRQRVDSDASSFYFQASSRANRRESAISVASLAPPISLYNRNNARLSQRIEESTYASFAQNYAVHNANGGRDMWAMHQRPTSMDSVSSDFSALQLGRPGVGDKMFDNSNPAPLSSITASPGYSDESYDNERREAMYDPRVSMYDMDGSDEQSQRQYMHDSLFEKTGYRSSVISSDESLFGSFKPQHVAQAHLRYRPISVASINSVHDAVKEGDTMITMLGGGRVRCISVSSAIEASPCARVGKRKFTHSTNPVEQILEQPESPNKMRIIEAKPPSPPKPSVPSTPNKGRIVKAKAPSPPKPAVPPTPSLSFGDKRMNLATKGLLERRSLEDTCLVGNGEESSVSMQSIPVFSRPRPSTRSRSSTYTSASSGRDTPPLSSSGYSSCGSQSSIDVSVLDMMLSDTTSPTVTSRARLRARGKGHKRLSLTQLSKSSIYETIEEEETAHMGSPKARRRGPTARQSIYINDSDSVSISGSLADETVWDNERGIEALRKFYALKEEAQDIVKESKRMWSDTAFSTYALQSFAIPHNPNGMRALLEHSQKNYGPLPYELRPRRIRSRTSSRATPYRVPTPVRAVMRSRSPSPIRSSSPAPSPAPLPSCQLAPAPAREPSVPAEPLPLREVRINANVSQFGQEDKASKSDLNKWGLPRPRVPLGWSKKSTGSKSSTSSKTSTGLKENAQPKTSSGLKENSGMGMSSGQTLRLNRPRPKARPTSSTVRSRPLAIYN